MDYTKLGNTGLDVSRICNGCMGFGDATRWVHPWVVGDEQAQYIPMLVQFNPVSVHF